MQDYVLMTDDNCDLPFDYYGANELTVASMPFILDDKICTAQDISPKEFYCLLRSGKLPTTVQKGVDEWLRYFEPLLQDGKDILYIAFSSGLSGTCSSAQVAARELSPQYPERRLMVIDSLCASLGQGLLVHKANKLKKAGMPMEELAKWVEDNRLKVSHMVAVDDLMHLHRGGRVSKTSAVAGTLLGIKPVIHMNNEGKLIPIDKVRGRRQSLQKIVEKTIALVDDTENDVFMISHSDCEEDANYVAELVEQHYGSMEKIIHFIGPVIGTHTGPGTVALFFMAKER